jgi:NAD-dependent deacetylase
MQPLIASQEALDKAANHLRRAETVAVLTGAGVSAESGLPTFRGAGGLWEGQRVEDVATPYAFERDPQLVWRFYNARRARLGSVLPNAGHLALVELEARLGSGRFTLITQNVDGLHRAAGSQHVLEIHGSLRRVRCTGCHRIEDRGVEPLSDSPMCSACGQLLRPAVVWFYEPLPLDIWNEAETAVRTAQCLIVAGTSAVVYPAAGLIEMALDAGASVIEVNPEETAASRLATVFLAGPSGQLLPELVKRSNPSFEPNDSVSRET